MFIQSTHELDSLLSLRKYCANGKNQLVGDLYDTVAESRWQAENLLAVYLTNPEHAWMAVWMAVTRRDRLKKRQLRYLRPRTGEDGLGRLEIHHHGRPPVENLFCSEAHLYLFDQERFADAEVLDISREKDKVSVLLQNGFKQETVVRRRWSRQGFVLDRPARRIVVVDEWQFAVVGYGSVAPDLHVTLGADLITSLSRRTEIHENEIGEDYIG